MHQVPRLPRKSTLFLDFRENLFSSISAKIYSVPRLPQKSTLFLDFREIYSVPLRRLPSGLCFLLNIFSAVSAGSLASSAGISEVWSRKEAPGRLRVPVLAVACGRGYRITWSKGRKPFLTYRCIVFSDWSYHSVPFPVVADANAWICLVLECLRSHFPWCINCCCSA